MFYLCKKGSFPSPVAIKDTKKGILKIFLICSLLVSHPKLIFHIFSASLMFIAGNAQIQSNARSHFTKILQNIKGIYTEDSWTAAIFEVTVFKCLFSNPIGQKSRDLMTYFSWRLVVGENPVSGVTSSPSLEAPEYWCRYLVTHRAVAAIASLNMSRWLMSALRQSRVEHECQLTPSICVTHRQRMDSTRERHPLACQNRNYFLKWAWGSFMMVQFFLSKAQYIGENFRLIW